MQIEPAQSVSVKLRRQYDMDDMVIVIVYRACAPLGHRIHPPRPWSFHLDTSSVYSLPIQPPHLQRCLHIKHLYLYLIYVRVSITMHLYLAVCFLCLLVQR